MHVCGNPRSMQSCMPSTNLRPRDSDPHATIHSYIFYNIQHKIHNKAYINIQRSLPRNTILSIQVRFFQLSAPLFDHLRTLLAS